MAASTKKTEKLEVRLPSELKDAFRQQCEAAGLTASEALRAFVEEQTAPQPPAPPELADPRVAPTAPGERAWLVLGAVVNAAHRGLVRAMTALVMIVGGGFFAAFVAMAALKPLWSDHVGLFRMADGTLSAGIVADPGGGQELLGLWSMPIAVGMAALLFAGLARVVRRPAGAPARLLAS